MNTFDHDEAMKTLHEIERLANQQKELEGDKTCGSTGLQSQESQSSEDRASSST